MTEPTPDQLPDPDVAIDQGEDVNPDELAGDPVDPGYLDDGAQDLDDEEADQPVDLVVDDATVAPSAEVE